MLHTYSGWGQERQRVTRLTSFMFCFQLAFGGWKTGLAKSACYAKCVPIWSDWILQKMSRYSAKAAQNTLQWEALAEWRGAIVLPFGFAEPFTKQFSSPHKKISFSSPGPCHPEFEFVDLMSVDSWSKMMDVNISGWEECWQFDWSNLIWRHREQRTGSSWFWSGTWQLTDNWVTEQRPKVSRKEKLTAYFMFLEMHLWVQISAPGAGSYPQLFRFHGSLFWQPFMQTRNYQRIKDDFMTREKCKLSRVWTFSLPQTGFWIKRSDKNRRGLIRGS